MSMSPADAALFEAVHELPLHATFGPQPSQTLVERLLDTIRRHVKAEAEALGEYQRIGDESGDPVIALVMQLVLQDEERHHGLLQRIADSLNDAVQWSHSPGALPTGGRVSGDAAALAAVTHGLVDEERHGARALRELAQQERGIADGLHSLLLEMMALDSEKHAHLLQFVERRLRTAPRA